MDCRKPLALALGLFLAGAGCVPNSTLPVSPPKAGTAPTPLVFESTNRDPKPSTYVAYGDVQLHAAVDPNRPPADREEYFENARKAYQQALTADPKYLPALVALAKLYATKGDYERAEGTYQKAVQVQPKNAATHYELGMCYARMKQWDAAVKSLQTATGLDSENRQYGNALGFTLTRLGRYPEAFTAFRKVNGEAEAHLNLARMLFQVRQEDLCRSHAQLALKANPQLAEARDLLAKLDNGSGHAYYAGAADLEEVRPDDPRLREDPGENKPLVAPR